MSTRVSAPKGTRSHPLHRTPAPSVITDARGSSSGELSRRVRLYTIAMAFRMACFLSMVLVEGWLRWTLLAFAVFLPYVAVVLANQANQRTTPSEVEPGAPEDLAQLTTGTTNRRLQRVDERHWEVPVAPDAQQPQAGGRHRPDQQAEVA